MINSGKSQTGFELHLNSIPHLVGEEANADRYIRAFVAMVNAVGDVEELDADSVFEAAKQAIRFVADDAFRSGFESCHQNVVTPLRESTVDRQEVADALVRHGERVRQAIVSNFEEEKDVPNQLTADIDAIELPSPGLFR